MEGKVWMRSIGGAEDVREEEGETRGVSKFRCSQLPEEHIAPGTKSQYHATLPLLPSVLLLSLLQQCHHLQLLLHDSLVGL